MRLGMKAKRDGAEEEERLRIDPRASLALGHHRRACKERKGAKEKCKAAFEWKTHLHPDR